LVNSPTGGAAVALAERNDFLINLGGLALILISALIVVVAIREALRRSFQKSALYAVVALIVGIFGLALSVAKTTF
jgi:beta-lactamase regulating signal transducer with metallopeptidase domain